VHQYSQYTYLSLAHGPIGKGRVNVCTSTKPAFASLSLSSSSLGATRPEAFIASFRSLLQRARGLSSFKEPSSLRMYTIKKKGSDNVPRSRSAYRLAKLTKRLRKLYVAARFDTAVGFVEHLRPFCDTCSSRLESDGRACRLWQTLSNLAKMDEIEGILIVCQFGTFCIGFAVFAYSRIRPLQFGIIDLKSATWFSEQFKRKSSQRDSPVRRNPVRPYGKLSSIMMPVQETCLVIRTMWAEAGYTQNNTVNVVDHGHWNQET
jgi:hypothetical protein